MQHVLTLPPPPPTCERCEGSGEELGVRTYHRPGRGAVQLCRPCSDEAAYEQAEAERNRWAHIQAQRAFDEAVALSDRLTPDDFAPGADAHDRYFDL